MKHKANKIKKTVFNQRLLCEIFTAFFPSKKIHIVLILIIKYSD